MAGTIDLGEYGIGNLGGIKENMSIRNVLRFCIALTLVVGIGVLAQPAAPVYDLLLRGGHVLDDKNHIDSVMDVAIKDGHIAKVAAHIPSSDALKTIDVKGLYVTPGLIDIHVHVYAGTGERNSYAGDLSVPPDGFTFRVGVTTVVDAGCSGWRNFEDFKNRIIDRSKTRVFAMLNMWARACAAGHYEQNTAADMDGAATAAMALKYPNTIVGIKTATLQRTRVDPVEQAVIAGTKANIPVMVDFGTDRPQRPIYDLMTKKLRPGDIYTHMYSGLRHEQDPVTLGPSKALIEGRKRGIYFDVGQGGGSFKWSLAVPMIKAGFIPDSISTDLHVDSMNSAMKNELNVADKIMAIGVPLKEIVAEMTSHPAREIRHEELGNLSQGSIADVAVLRLQSGNYGFTDMMNTRLDGKQKLICELTIKDGKIVYDLNGISTELWNAPPGPHAAEAWRWTTFAPAKRTLEPAWPGSRIWIWATQLLIIPGSPTTTAGV